MHRWTPSTIRGWKSNLFYWVLLTVGVLGLLFIWEQNRTPHYLSLHSYVPPYVDLLDKILIKYTIICSCDVNKDIDYFCKALQKTRCIQFFLQCGFFRVIWSNICKIVIIMLKRTGCTPLFVTWQMILWAG